MTANVSQQDVNAIAAQVTSVMIVAANATIGRKISKGRKTAPWWCAEYNEARVRSQNLYETAQRSKIASDWTAFAVARKAKNVLKRKLKSKQASTDESATARVWASNYGSKEAWIAAKRLRNARAGMNSKSAASCRGISNGAGEFVDKPSKVAEVFRQHYKTLATPSTVAGYDADHYARVERDVLDWQTNGKGVFQDEYDAAFSDAEIEAAIDKLPMHKAEDGEGIIGELVRHGGGFLRALLLRLINWVWHLESVPEKWAEGIVVNLYKAGDALDPGNYRGITLIPIIRKLFSTMIRLRLEKKVSLHESQAAFRARRSCIDHIFTLSQIIHETGAVKKSLYVFFLDIKKAYDTVWRAGLFFKLMEKGVKGKMWRVLLDMFGKARSTVRVGGELSTLFDLMVGVGQGDPLSTLLFDVFIDDLLVELHSMRAASGVRLASDAATVATTYADDVGCVSHEAHGLQASIDHIADWLNKWRMQPNVAKSAVMVFHPQDGQAASVPVAQRAHTWTLNGHTLTQVESYKYLGVWFTENGSWDLHTSKALCKMRSALGYWKPLLSCHRLPLNARAMMIQTLIYSAGLYGSEVWAATSAMRDSFDAVAKDAIRSVMGLHRCEATSDALFSDMGLLPPSLLIDAAKQCYLRHLDSLTDDRWCKTAMACRFSGPRSAGRPRVEANWLGEVHNCSLGICRDLNVAELTVPIVEQEPVRRVSSRTTSQTGSSIRAVQHTAVATPSSGHAPLNREVILDMFWAWKVYRMKAKYTTAPTTHAAWFTDCVDPLKRCRSGYLSSLPSYKSRLILSARSGKLFSLHKRLAGGESAHTPPTEYQCSDCGEHLGDAKTACLHCMVDCPNMWPKLDLFFAEVHGLGGRGASYAAHLEALLGEDLVKAMINPKKDFLPQELTGGYWSAVERLRDTW